MGAHQLRLWKRMLDITEAFVQDRIDLRSLIAGLESAFHASEIKDEALASEFWDHWSHFEMSYACGLESKTPPDKKLLEDYAAEMKEFLSRTLGQVETYDPSKT